MSDEMNDLRDLPQHILDSDEFCSCIEVALHQDQKALAAWTGSTLYGAEQAERRNASDCMAGMLTFVVNSFVLSQDTTDAVDVLFDFHLNDEANKPSSEKRLAAIDTLTKKVRTVRTILEEIEELSVNVIALQKEMAQQRDVMADINENLMVHLVLVDDLYSNIETAVPSIVSSFTENREKICREKLINTYVAPAVASSVRYVTKYAATPFVGPTFAYACSFVVKSALDYGRVQLNSMLSEENRVAEIDAREAKRGVNELIAGFSTATDTVRELQGRIELVASDIACRCLELGTCCAKKSELSTNIVRMYFTTEKFMSAPADLREKCEGALLAGYRSVMKYHQMYMFVESFDELILAFEACILKWKNLYEQLIEQTCNVVAKSAQEQMIGLTYYVDSCIEDNLVVQINKVRIDIVKCDSDCTALYVDCLTLTECRKKHLTAQHAKIVEFQGGDPHLFEAQLSSVGNKLRKCISYELQYKYELKKYELDRLYCVCRDTPSPTARTNFESTLSSVKCLMQECVDNATSNYYECANEIENFWWKHRCFELSMCQNDLLFMLEKVMLMLNFEK